MYCKHCGIAVDDDSTFCSNCGKPIGAPSGSGIVGSAKNKRKFLFFIFIAVCIGVAVAIVIFAKQTNDTRRAEEEAIAASIAEAESIAQAQAIAESIAMAESLAYEEARNQYISYLNDFVVTSAEGFDISQNMCNLVYMVSYDTAYQNYRDETAAYTMTDGVFHETIGDSIDVLFQSEEYLQMAETLEANKLKVATIYQQLAKPTEEFEEAYRVTGLMLEAYQKLYTHAMSVQANDTIFSYSEEFEEYSNDYVENYERMYFIIPQS